MSDTVAVALISGASGLFGAAIGGVATFVAQRSSRREHRRDELATTVARLMHGLQQLEIEIETLPAPTGWPHDLTRWLERRLPALAATLHLIARHTTARSAYRALDAVTEPLSRLSLVAPVELLPQLDRLATAMQGVEQRDEDWMSRWRAARSELVASTRVLLDS